MVNCLSLQYQAWVPFHKKFNQTSVGYIYSTIRDILLNCSHCDSLDSQQNKTADCTWPSADYIEPSILWNLVLRQEDSSADTTWLLQVLCLYIVVSSTIESYLQVLSINQRQRQHPILSWESLEPHPINEWKGSFSCLSFFYMTVVEGNILTLYKTTALCLSIYNLLFLKKKSWDNSQLWPIFFSPASWDSDFFPWGVDSFMFLVLFLKQILIV